MSEMNTNNTVPSGKDVTLYLSDFWRGFVKFWWICAILSILFGGMTFYRSYIRFTPIYKVSATFTVHTENNTLAGDSGVSAYSFYYDRNTADQLATVFPYALQSAILQQKVCDDLNMNYMPASVSASCVTGTNMVTLTTTGRDPQLTYNVMESVIKNYSSVTDFIIGRTKLVMISEPEIPTEPSNTLAWRMSTLKGAFLGGALGMNWIILYAVLRRTIRTKEDIRKELNQHCIGILPQVVFKKYRKKINLDILLTNPLIGNQFLESLRLLRSAVQNSLNEGDKVVMITSTAPGEGKSVTTINLAAMFAKNEARILVIDGDLRNSGISALLGTPPQKENEKDDLYSIRKIDSLGIDLLNFNTKAHRLWKIMRTSKFKETIDILREQYDLIFIDTPPCGIISDATVIAGAADAVLYVVKQDTVMSTSIRAGINTLLSTDVKLLGCVLNGTVGGAGGYGNYYGYGGYSKYYRYGYYGKGYHQDKKHRTEK